MISKKMQNALNEQIKHEIYSAHLYLAMSAHCESNGLKGFAHWLQLQYDEEMMHAMKFYRYVLDQGATIALQEIPAPPSKFESVLEMFEEVLKHEQFVTASIHKLVDLALAEKDHATTIFLQWFVTEQVEEEASAQDIIDQLKLVGKEKSGLFMINREMGTRTAATADA
ncbi:ferritin [Desulfurispirillum indicum]|uniref:Ferritin n=1 Tax=Desulfurispirillum indicum (strain ATCC BAA-1389 / DSM 22839 / S5) TaxID=653733 RepID=E6W147_DESIS|nr:ferritin [Desulfurispirillum indicum]ADU66467.1 Ferroxidase [Desulfurispirillum indicum S5]UCZ55803.1 ferritin [Desulfurispirillum indicum]